MTPTHTITPHVTPHIVSMIAEKPESRRGQAEQFLEALFSAKEPSEYILTWLLDGRRSTWFQDTAATAAFIEANKHKDVYVGVALSPADHGPTLRLKLTGNERMPSSIVGLWADLDVLGPGHQKKNLPASEEDAKSVLFPDMPPTLIVRSGGGLQPWWLFKEPWSLESDEEARRAGALATRWIRAIRARAAARGWDVDSVGDLTRVLRVPGATNCKIPGTPRPTSLIDVTDCRYNPKDLDEYLDLIGAEQVSPIAAMVVPGEKLEYASNAEPPVMKFMALCDAEPRFKASWDHLRKDLQDQSASSYDMALANTAATAEWTDQEIANLLIAHRRRYGQDLKLRDSYYQTTITKAHRPGFGFNVNATPKSSAASTPNQVTEITTKAIDRLYGILDECKSTGKGQRLFEVSVLLAAISDGQWNDFLADAKKAAGESKNGLRINLNDLNKARRIAKEEVRNARRKAALAPATTTGKPTIIISNRQLCDLRTECVGALQQGNTPPMVFRRLRELARFCEAGEAYLENVNWMSMRSRLTDVAVFLKEGSGGQEHTFPPRPVCEEILAFNHTAGTFPEVDAITRAPVVRPDGSIFCIPGFDPISKMIFVPLAGFVLPPIPECPTSDEVEAAKQLLLDVIVDFPFEDSADKTNFIAFCLTPLIRQLVDVVPMCLFDAPVSGAGKGLLVDVGSIICTGEVAAVIAPPASREEWGKLIFSLLDAGRSFVVFDNLRSVLQSDALEAVLTKPSFQSRVLGLSKERVVPNRATWATTGNNIAVGRDMVRRCFRVRINPKCSQPHLRKNFKQQNLVEHCKSDRASLLAALLVLIRAWYSAGQPASGGTQLGSYTRWRTIVGGILKHVGLADFLGNQRKLYNELDVESEEWERFLLGIEDRYKGEEFSTGDLVNLIHAGNVALPREVAEIYGQSLTHDASKPNPSFAVRLGNILRGRRGTRYGESEVYLERGTEDHHKKIVLHRINHGSGR